MSSKINGWVENLNSSSLIKLLGAILVSALLVVFVVFLTYFSNFNDEFSLKQEVWGTFGDFIGGTLNPLLSFLGLIALLFTIVLQNKELEATREELTRAADAQEKTEITQSAQSKILLIQQFENTFFSLLQQHNKILNELSAPQEWRTDKKAILAILIEAIPKKVNLKEAKEFIEKNNDNCGHYFRVLYQILKLIAVHRGSVDLNNFNQNLIDKPITEDEKLYSNIVRSFISYDLMQVLAVNCYCDSSSNTYWSYKLLIERYEFLEHMPITGTIPFGAEKSLIAQTIDYYELSAFGKSGFLKTYLKENT